VTELPTPAPYPLYGGPPVLLGKYDFSLPEVMYYLYLPVFMEEAGHEYGDTTAEGLRLPPALECCRSLIEHAMILQNRQFRYIYLSARKGWATPDNPLNRPGWHCDGFGTDDMNFIWWRGPGTRFATGDFGEISKDHNESMNQFTKRIAQADFDYRVGIAPRRRIVIDTPPQAHLYAIDPYVVHATPILTEGCMRQFVKISLSDHRYDLYNNSHNYLFDYDWPMRDRETIRNDPYAAQRDYSE